MGIEGPEETGLATQGPGSFTRRCSQGDVPVICLCGYNSGVHGVWRKAVHQALVKL